MEDVAECRRKRRSVKQRAGVRVRRVRVWEQRQEAKERVKREESLIPADVHTESE